MALMQPPVLCNIASARLNLDIFLCSFPEVPLKDILAQTFRAEETRHDQPNRTIALEMPIRNNVPGSMFIIKL
jgi:hypothetical protein